MLKEYLRGMGLNVATMAYSTPRWSGAVRVISVRLASFYEQSVRMTKVSSGKGDHEHCNASRRNSGAAARTSSPPCSSSELHCKTYATEVPD
jgi:hypothetical protein